jgi:hypothetical protein
MILFSNPVYYLLAYARCNGIKYKIDGHILTIYHVFDPRSEIFKKARFGLYEELYMGGKKYVLNHTYEVYRAGEFTKIVLPRYDVKWNDIIYSENKRDNHTWICGVQASPYYDTAGGLVIDRLVTEDELKMILEREGKPVCKEVEPGVFYCDYAYVNMIHKGNCENVAVIPFSQFKLASSLPKPVYVVPDPFLFCNKLYPSQLSTNKFLNLLEIIWDNFTGGGIPVKFVEDIETGGYGVRKLFDRYFAVRYGKSTNMGKLINAVIHDVATALDFKFTYNVDYYISETANALDIPVSRFSVEQIRSLKDALLDAMSRNVYYLKIPLCSRYEYSGYKLKCIES